MILSTNKLFCLFFLIYMLMAVQNIQPQQPPLIVNSIDKVVEDIVKQINRNLPRGISVLLNDVNHMNPPNNISSLYSKEITGLFIKTSKESNLDMTYINEAVKNESHFLSILKNFPSQSELLSIAKLTKFDSMLFVNYTLMTGETRNVWSTQTRTLEKKEIYLLQANLYNPDNHAILMRFYMFFY